MLRALIPVLFLSGCASNYEQYAQAQIDIAKAQAEAQKVKYQALLAIADSGSDTAKVAAVMALNMPGEQNNKPQMAPPKDPSQTALQWLGVIAPTLVQGYGVYANTRLGIVQSNNNTALGVAQSSDNVEIETNTNGTMRGIAELITIPEAVVVEHTTETVTVVEQPEPVIVEPVIVNPQVVNPVVVDPVVIQ